MTAEARRERRAGLAYGLMPTRAAVPRRPVAPFRCWEGREAGEPSCGSPASVHGSRPGAVTRARPGLRRGRSLDGVARPRSRATLRRGSRRRRRSRGSGLRQAASRARALVLSSVAAPRAIPLDRHRDDADQRGEHGDWVERPDRVGGCRSPRHARIEESRSSPIVAMRRPVRPRRRVSPPWSWCRVARTHITAPTAGMIVAVSTYSLYVRSAPWSAGWVARSNTAIAVKMAVAVSNAAVGCWRAARRRDARLLWAWPWLLW